MGKLGGASDKSDLSYIDQPSIAEHPQNRKHRDWTALIDLTRDAWLAVAESSHAHDRIRARNFAASWIKTPYPLFKRLAFFAATHSLISPHIGLTWLLSEKCWWLWSTHTRRESMLLLTAISLGLGVKDSARLQKAVLRGPPRRMYREDLESEQFALRVDREIWLRLKKMKSSGADLCPEASTKLCALSSQYPHWEASATESDDFPFWMHVQGSSEMIASTTFIPTPRRRADLIEWIKKNPTSDYDKKDDWKERCRDEFPRTSCTLCAPAKDSIWPVDRWREALQSWLGGRLLKLSWNHMGPVFLVMPDECKHLLEYDLSRWLEDVAAAGVIHLHDSVFFKLCKAILQVKRHDDAGVIDFEGHINHPVGCVAQALINYCFKQSPEDQQSLPNEVKAIFTDLCGDESGFRSGRAVLAENIIVLFQVDPAWVKQHLYSLFDWERSEIEACTAWQSFLSSPRLHRPLMEEEEMKKQFLVTAQHYSQLDELGQWYAVLLTNAALELEDLYMPEEVASAISKLPNEGLGEVAQTIAFIMEDTPEEQRSNYWTNRIVPFLGSVWPSMQDQINDSEISDSLGRLCIAAGEKFPEAVHLIKEELNHVKHPGDLTYSLSKTNLCERFPEEALTFLYLTIDCRESYSPLNLEKCLNDIKKSAPELVKDGRYTKLLAHSGHDS